ncbi:putative structural protein [Escherichia phage vB_EcoM_fHy-Eco03]|nr:putative structural protein [Escherichia phage vB_EcoM_fHy-Eco03]
MGLPLKEIVNVQIGVSSGGPGIPEDVPVRGIGLSKYFWEMRVNATDRLYPMFNPTNSLDRKVYWTEDSDGKIVTVDDDGRVTGRGIGQAYVTCVTEDGAYRATCLYNILRALILVTSIELDAYAKTIEEGQSFQLNATVLPENADDKTLRWASDNPDVATVSNSGLVIALKAGTANITATNNVVSNPCIVTVTPPVIHVTGITLDENSINHVKGDTKQLEAYVVPTNATNKAVSWSSSDTSIATVDDTGLVTCVDVGTATITAKTVDGGYDATCSVKVIPAIVRVTGVTLDQDGPLDLEINDTQQLSATVTPDDATDKTVVWDTTDANVLIVSAEGLVTCVGEGIASITVTTNDGGFTDSVEIKVTNPNIAVTGVAWATNSPTKVSIGHQVQTKIVITPDNATNKKVSYNSSNPDAVTVDTNGVIYGQSPGTSTITVTTDDGGLEASFVAACTEVAVITPDGLGGIPIGGTQQFTYTVSPSDAELTNIRYESADPAIATVDSSGVVTGVASGGCNIWIYATSNGADISAATWAQISEKVQVYPQYAEWLVGNTKQLDVEIYPSDSKSVTVTYESSDDTIISVDANGLMTAKSEGSATITANVVMNGVAASGTTSPYVSELSVTTDSLPALIVGNTQQLVVTVRPEYAKTDPDYNIQYTTTDDTVATVSNTGVITGVGSGGCRIGATVTVRNATSSDSSYQSVNAA